MNAKNDPILWVYTSTIFKETILLILKFHLHVFQLYYPYSLSNYNDK